MSAGEESGRNQQCRSMMRGLKNVQLLLTVVSVVSSGKSMHHLIFAVPLPMCNSEKSSLMNTSALAPS